MTPRTKMATKRVALRLSSIAALACLVAATAMAGAPKGRNFVEGANPKQGTIVLDGSTYRLPQSTPIVGLKGETVALADLRVVPEGVVLVSIEEADLVEWEAVETPTGWQITSIRLLEGLPN